MIPDDQTDMVFISDRLEEKYPALVDGLRRILTDHDIPLRTIEGTKDIWCRDYMPIPEIGRRVDSDIVLECCDEQSLTGTRFRTSRKKDVRGKSPRRSAATLTFSG